MKFLICFFVLFSITTAAVAQDSMSIYPNPFKDSTNISFYLSQDSKISLTVYNMYGNTVGIPLNDTPFAAGSYTISYGNDLKTGRYVIKLQTESNKSIAKLISKGTSPTDIKGPLTYLNLSAYPNPISQGYLTLSAERPFPPGTYILLYNHTGQMIKQMVMNDTSDKKYKIPVDNLPSGIYLLQMMYGNYSQTVKFIKQ